MIYNRNLKFGVWVHLGMAECGIPFSGHCNLDLLPCFLLNCVQSISLISFEVGISNLMCACILE